MDHRCNKAFRMRTTLAAEVFELDLMRNYAKLADLFCYILWQQQGIYIKPYPSYESLERQSPEMLRKGIRSVLTAFETLKVNPDNYLEYDARTGQLTEKVPLVCIGAENTSSASITELLSCDSL